MATQTEIKELATEIGKHLAIGMSLHAIAKQLNITYEKALTAKEHLAKDIIENEGGTMWLGFHVQMARQFQELLLLKQKAKEVNNLNAEIGAQKLIMDLTSRQIDYAIKVGFIKAVPMKIDLSLEGMATSWEKFFSFKGINKELVNAN